MVWFSTPDCILCSVLSVLRLFSCLLIYIILISDTTVAGPRWKCFTMRHEVVGSWCSLTIILWNYKDTFHSEILKDSKYSSSCIFFNGGCSQTDLCCLPLSCQFSFNYYLPHLCYKTTVEPQNDLFSPLQLINYY